MNFKGKKIMKNYGEKVITQIDHYIANLPGKKVNGNEKKYGKTRRKRIRKL